jgi:glycerophosphoryl diester phosphodiesterase
MSGDDRTISRRTLLRAVGFTAATGALALSGVLTGGAASAVRPITAQEWAAGRGPRYHIAHRGSGDVLPEHSMPAYQAAVDWGADCLEISVGITSDGVLICMHDPTYDRTTTGTGKIVDQPSSVLDSIRIWQPRLGQAWTDNPPRVPLFEDVLRSFGGAVVLAVEAKVPQAYAPMMAMVERMGLRKSVIVKAYYRSDDLATAAGQGYPVFCYFGTADDATPDAITEAAGRLDPHRDCLVLPAFTDGPGSFLPDSTVAVAGATGIPVWVFPLHRRSDAEHFFALGVQGAVCSSYGYIAGVVPPVTADAWGRLAIASGEMTKNPSWDGFAPAFTAAGELVLAAENSQHFVTMGQCGPIPTSTPGTIIEVDGSWQTLPRKASDSLSVAFGRVDDSYYAHRLGAGDGCHVILRANGELALYRHHDGNPDGELLGSAASPPLTAGQWARLRITTTADGVAVARTDSGTTVTAASVQVSDGYLHLGRTSKDGVGAFRALRIA